MCAYISCFLIKFLRSNSRAYDLIAFSPDSATGDLKRQEAETERVRVLCVTSALMKRKSLS